MAEKSTTFFDFERVTEALDAAGLDRSVAVNRIDWQKNQLLFHDSDVQIAEAIVRGSGVLDLLATWRAEDMALTNPRGAGRKPVFDPYTVLVVMTVFALRKYPMYVSDMARTFVNGAWSKAALERLGVTTRMVRDRNQLGEFTGNAENARLKRWYAPFWYQLSHGVLAYFDPYFDLPRHKRMKTDEYEAYKRGEQLLGNARALALIAKQDDETLAEARLRTRNKYEERAHTFCNALVRASVALLGKEVLDEWDGTVVCDGTGIPLPGQGPRRNSAHVPIMVWGGFHSRQKDQDGTMVMDKDKTYFAMEDHIIQMGGKNFGGDKKYPALALSFSFDRPGVSPASNAMRAMQPLIDDEAIPKGFFISDRGYVPHAKADELQMKLRLAGYKLNADQRKGTTGFQHQFKSGVVQVDGQFFCPLVRFIPHFEDPWGDWLNDEISEDERDNILELRQQLAMRPKSEPDANGNQVFRCPAQGEGATATCPFKTGRLRANPYGFQLDVALKNAQKAGAAVGNGPLKVCQNKESTTVPLVELPAFSKREQKRREKMSDEQKEFQDNARFEKAVRHVKYQQQGPGWQTSEWRRLYGGRNAIEGLQREVEARPRGWTRRCNDSSYA